MNLVCYLEIVSKMNLVSKEQTIVG